MPVLLAALIALSACSARAPEAAEPLRSQGPHLIRAYGHGFPWAGYQQPYVGRP